MKLLMLFLLAQTAFAVNIPHLTVADTINPGTADYIVTNIEKAEKDHAPFLLIQMDTPGGLLTATRTIVQKMLNSKIPIVVFVGPKGAHAGSAGAIITFAADVAAMAPGTNIGAAHPVVPGQNQENTDKTMNDKMVNDTAAFAEGLAKSKGRNTEWARKAVTESASIIADKALEYGVIDLIAEDLSDLTKKLPGFKLKTPKNNLKTLPSGEAKLSPVVLTVKQKIVSFFSNPNVAYLIMSFAGLCIWIELTHPGLIVPGVLGGICIILSMISFQMLPIHYGALAFIVLGLVLLIAEVFIPSFGIVGLSGILCFIFGSLFLMDTNVPEFQISLGVILPTALVLGAFTLLLAYLVVKSHRRRTASGLQSFVGEFAEVRDEVTKQGGMVFLHGELWNAVTESDSVIEPKSTVRVKEVKNMTLLVDKMES